MATATRDAQARTALPPLLPLLAALACAPLVGHLPVWTFLFAGALLLARGLSEKRGFAPARVTLKAGLAVVALALVLDEFHTLRGAEPGFSFFVTLFGLKLLEATDERDFIVVILLGYVAFLGGLVFVPSIAMALYAIAFLVLSLVALNTVIQPRGPASADRVRLVLALLVRAAPVALVAYLLFPRFTGGLWGGSVSNRRASTGISRTLRPGAYSALIPSRRIAFRIIFPAGRVPPRMQRYFRVYVMNRTDGRTWRAASARDMISPPVGRADALRYTVLLEPTGRRALPALDWPLPTNGTALVSGDLLRSRHRIDHLVRYRAAATPSPPATLSDRTRARDLALPPNLDPRVLRLARDLAGGDRTVMEKVGRTLHYFSAHHFTYSLAPPPMGDRPIARFLFSVRRGYCTDYAAAFATLMRAEGVPARVVVGYAGGTFNPIGHDVIVRARDAHAWTEVWNGSHWMRVDPTLAVAPMVIDDGISAVVRLVAHHRGPLVAPSGPADLPARSSLAEARHRWMLWHDALTTTWDNWVTGYDWRRQGRLLARLGWHGARRRGLAILLAVLLAILLLVLRARGARWRPRDSAIRLYTTFLRRLARLGLTRSPHEGPDDFARRVISARPDLEAPVRSITTAYVGIRYADRHDELGRLRETVRRFRPRPRP
ncbi:MAG: transglutaminase TgpA family protein [Acidiferrobacteraceae bacterium]